MQCQRCEKTGHINTDQVQRTWMAPYRKIAGNSNGVSVDVVSGKTV
jgi:hypothetical protein